MDQLRGTSQRFGVRAMPTFHVLRAGRSVASVQGADPNALRKAVIDAAAGHGPQAPAH